jgi:two-component system, OmpR family, response regulator CpxR
MNRILIIDDDTELCQLLSDYLGSEGFETTAVHAGGAGAELAASGDYDLVILDVMLPELNGFDVLRRLRATSMVPVLMLTARGDDVDRIVGLELGADDYLPKPFNPRELVARIRAIQRRSPIPAEGVGAAPVLTRPEILRCGDLTLDTGRHLVVCGGKPVAVTGVEFSLLYHLLKNVGRVVSRDELTTGVLGRKLEIFDRSIDVHISSLRKKLGRRMNGRERILTVRGVGYQYLAESD